MTMNSRTRWFALYTLTLASLMIVLDATIVNVALPSIRQDLDFSQTSLAWVVNAYLLTYGGFLLLGGRLGDLFGHRRLFLAGITLFTVASLACGLSTSQGMLIAARSVQGLGGGGSSARRRRRGDGHRRADARRLRDRERQPGRLELRPDARPARRRGGAPRRLPLDRDARRRAARAARPLQAAERRDRQRGRRAVGGGDVRLVLPRGALPPARARVQPARGRPLVPAGQPDHGDVLARAVREDRHALRLPAAARDRPRPRRGRAPALRPGAGRRQLPRRRPPEHDPARLRCGSCLQPGAPRRYERRRPERVRPRVRRR